MNKKRMKRQTQWRQTRESAVSGKNGVGEDLRRASMKH